METFEKVKWMQLPRDVLIGHGVLEEISRVCKHLGVRKKAIIVTGVHHTKKIAGERVLEILSEAGYEVNLEEVPSICVESLEHVKNVSSAKKAKFILGVGGGSVIDTAKIASFELGIPFISVPTIASHDGIVSPRASMKDKDKGNTVSIQAHAPLAVVADTKIISSAPYRFTAAGCGDLLANYTAIRDWRLAQRLRNAEFSSYAAALSEMTANMVMENVTEIKQKDREANRKDYFPLKSAFLFSKKAVTPSLISSVAKSSLKASASDDSPSIRLALSFTSFFAFPRAIEGPPTRVWASAPTASSSLSGSTTSLTSPMTKIQSVPGRMRTNSVALAASLVNRGSTTMIGALLTSFACRICCMETGCASAALDPIKIIDLACLISLRLFVIAP